MVNNSNQTNPSNAAQNISNATLKIKPRKRGGLFSRIKDQIKKEFKLLKTDKINLFIAILLPPLVIILFGTMLLNASDYGPVQVAVVSFDGNAYITPNDYVQTTFENYTIPFVDAVNQSGKVTLDNRFLNGSKDYDAIDMARELLRNKVIQVIIIIPADFSELLMAGYPGMLDAIPDTSDVKQVQRYLNAIQDCINIFAKNQNFSGQFQINKDYTFAVPPDYDLEYTYMMTLVLAFIVFGISCVLTILVVVQEQPIARLLLTPVSKSEILIAKYITYILILLLQVVLIYAASVGMGLYIQGNIRHLFIGLFIMGYVGIALGMFISTLSKTKMEANQLFFAFFIVIVLLSGIFIPIAAMPSYLQLFANLLPLSHGSPMIAGIVNKGKSVFGPDFNFLALQGIILTILSFINMKRKNYEV